MNSFQSPKGTFFYRSPTASEDSQTGPADSKFADAETEESDDSHTSYGRFLYTLLSFRFEDSFLRSMITFVTILALGFVFMANSSNSNSKQRVVAIKGQNGLGDSATGNRDKMKNKAATTPTVATKGNLMVDTDLKEQAGLRSMSVPTASPSPSPSETDVKDLRSELVTSTPLLASSSSSSPLSSSSSASRSPPSPKRTPQRFSPSSSQTAAQVTSVTIKSTPTSNYHDQYYTPRAAPSNTPRVEHLSTAIPRNAFTSDRDNRNDIATNGADTMNADSASKLIDIASNLSVLHKRYIITIVALQPQCSLLLREIKTEFKNDPLIFAEHRPHHPQESSAGSAGLTADTRDPATDQGDIIADKLQKYFRQRRMNVRDGVDATGPLADALHSSAEDTDNEIAYKLKKYFEKRNIHLQDDEPPSPRPLTTPMTLPSPLAAAPRSSSMNGANHPAAPNPPLSSRNSPRYVPHHGVVALSRGGASWVGLTYERVIQRPSGLDPISAQGSGDPAASVSMEELDYNRERILVWLRKILSGEVVWSSTETSDSTAPGYPVCLFQP